MCSLSEKELAHNASAVARWCAERGVDLAPHGKTTMSPELINRQLAHGAWAITAATPWQAERMVDWGVPRIVLANVCADPGPLAHLLTRDVEVVTFVPSPYAALPPRSRQVPGCRFSLKSGARADAAESAASRRVSRWRPCWSVSRGWNWPGWRHSRAR
ncbi:MAG TPA: hypothetical protein GXZ30_14175 [Propionibacterium sp.]|nr:hypothetical protein [Propionibacterium sp.]